MRRRFLFTLAALTAVGLVAGAVPAFSDDTGTLSVTIAAQGPTEACIEFATPPGTSLDFGTKGFTVYDTSSTSTAALEPVFRNCGSAAEQVVIAGTDATSGATTWALVGSSPFFCAPGPRPLNDYRLQYIRDSSVSAFVGKTPTTLLGAAAPGADHRLQFTLWMPCAGSDGAGETFTANVILTATVP